MPAADAADLIALFEGEGIVVWVDGGWAVDAVLGEQTRVHGDGVYGPPEVGEFYRAAALTGEGTIAGRRVRCIAPAWLVRFRTGYPPRAVDRADVAALCERLGIEVPAAYRAEP